MPSLPRKEYPMSIDATIDQVLDFIDANGPVSFTDVENYMAEERLRFGAATDPIEVLDLAAYRTNRIDINFDEQKIYSRRAAPTSTAAASTSPRVLVTDQR
jgi:hypothetical protein